MPTLALIIFLVLKFELITKYGGANSHMTIRCNELNIPAAIGCGKTLFSKLKLSNKVNLNCKNFLIKID